ncbi:putative Mediator of RNA polymerase II transcription subunit 8 [Hypsibius exemplaris]|uniref:Mediator of RNA polymerase II transcription subunit 8 n=1 Tax=Hypsibius exemplaris TaxID=2072580 RepID=A0A1W0XD97_HYPEX|nr:putative Mediator of RNA polymerase II transcription subunit 8 [Hypsibius exemplaris]
MQRPAVPAAALTTGPGGIASNGPGGTNLRPPADPGIELLLSSISNIKANISALLQYIETQPDSLSWPAILDRFNVIMSQIVVLSSQMKNDRLPDLRKLTVVPFLVSPDPDSTVERITEGRMATVNHENVPNYLRTKLDPEVENRFEAAYLRIPLPNTPAETLQKQDKQIQNLNKVVNTLIEQFQTAQNDWDSKTAKAKLPPTSDPNDTILLLAAVTAGKNFPSQMQHGGPKFPGFPQGNSGPQIGAPR